MLNGRHSRLALVFETVVLATTGAHIASGRRVSERPAGAAGSPRASFLFGERPVTKSFRVCTMGCGIATGAGSLAICRPQREVNRLLHYY
jgi:hypothetical protein